MQLFEYETHLISGCKLFDAEPFKSAVSNMAAMVIKSKKYTNFEECRDDATQLIATFASLLEQVTDKKYVVMTKLNPMHDDLTADETVAEKEGWEKNLVLRVYAADSQLIKTENLLRFTIFANVRVSLETINAVYSCSTTTLQ